MPDTTPEPSAGPLFFPESIPSATPGVPAPIAEHHPFDPEAIKRVAAFVAAIPASVITIAIRPGGTLRRPDLAQLLERDEWSDTTRLELAEGSHKLRGQLDVARTERTVALGRVTAAEKALNNAYYERDEMRRNYDNACKLVADMHAAAVGEVRGPDRGVVEDIADLRARCLAAEEALQIALHGAQPTINNPEGWEDSWDRARADEAAEDTSVYAPGEQHDDLPAHDEEA